MIFALVILTVLACFVLGLSTYSLLALLSEATPKPGLPEMICMVGMVAAAFVAGSSMSALIGG